MLYNNARLYDEWDGEDYSGSSCRGAMKGWHRHGVCGEKFFPYKDEEFVDPDPSWALDALERPLGAYYRIDALSIADMQAAVVETHAVYASAKVHDGWELETAESIDEAEIRQGTHPVFGGHAFAVVGYTRKGFIIQNSWGSDWGFNGFGVLPYSDWGRNGYDAWVVAIGAPVDVGDRQLPGSKSEASLVMQSARAGSEESEEEDNRALEVWTEGDAYRRAVVCGNEGQMLRRLPEAENAAHNFDKVFDRVAEEAAKTRYRHLVFYAHGGITDEQSAIRHVTRLGPAFEANGILPVFFVWKTGILESLRHIGADHISSFQEKLDGMRSEGLAESLIDSFREKRDRTFELAARQVIGRSVWTQIKQNAAAAELGEGAIRKVSAKMRVIRTNNPDLKIHFVGHSAGAIWLGHMANDFREAGLGGKGSPLVATTTLWAPACTLAFANRFYGGAFRNNILDPAGFHVDVLSDDRERDDYVGSESLYGKSVLYLVSRALEDRHKTPLLGLKRAWPDQIEAAYSADFFNPASRADANAWAEICGKLNIDAEIHDQQQVDTGAGKVRLSHGSFDNDIDSSMAMLTRILGRRPRRPVRKLV